MAVDIFQSYGSIFRTNIYKQNDTRLLRPVNYKYNIPHK